MGLTSHEWGNEDSTQKKGSKVWVVHDKLTYGFDKAERYGEIVNLSEGRINIFNTDVLQSQILPNLLKVEKEDYLLIVGHALICYYAINYVVRKFGYARCLLYAAGTGNYKAIRIDDEDFDPETIYG